MIPGKRFLVFSVVASAVATAAAAVYTSAQTLVTVALHREPAVIQTARKIRPARLSRDPYIREVDAAARRLAAQPAEEIRLTGYDGTRLVGHWIPAREPKRVLIAMHGWRSSWDRDFGLISSFWEDKGCSVLYAEQRAQNASGGEYMGFGLTERFDCLGWAEWASVRAKGLPVYLWGLSMGASSVLMAAGLRLPESVRGIIADCGFTSPRAIWKSVAENKLHIRYGLQGLIADDICRRKIDFGAGDYSTTEALRHAVVPVLLIHGTGDKFVPVSMTYENYSACASPKRLFLVPDAEHARSYAADKAGYEAAVCEFWREFDAPRGG